VAQEDMMFQISALSRQPFEPFFGMNDEALAQRGIRRYVADRTPGFPCRVSLQDAAPGERVLLVPYAHMDVDSPYRASGPVFVRESAAPADLAPDAVPQLLRSRMLSLRAYDQQDLMISADVVDGRELESAVARILADQAVRYVHVHFAKPGCYACKIDRS
jgi:hypothetical protein